MTTEEKIKKVYNDPLIDQIGINAFHNKLLDYGINIALDELKYILSKEESYKKKLAGKTQNL